MVIFRTAGEAVHCTVAVRRCLQDENHRAAMVEEALLCVGIDYVDMLHIGDTNAVEYTLNSIDCAE